MRKGRLGFNKCRRFHEISTIEDTAQHLQDFAIPTGSPGFKCFLRKVSNDRDISRDFPQKFRRGDSTGLGNFGRVVLFLERPLGTLDPFPSFPRIQSRDWRIRKNSALDSGGSQSGRPIGIKKDEFPRKKETLSCGPHRKTTQLSKI